MRKAILILGFALVPVLSFGQGRGGAPQEVQAMPEWVYPETQMGIPMDQARAVTTADDAVRAQVYPTVPDSVPEIIRKGKAGNGVCMGCHLPSGFGQPQSAPIAALPAAYIVHTLNDFISGDRKAYRPQMAQFAKNMTADEIKDVAAYYSSLHFTSWIVVKESDTAPKIFIAGRDIVAKVPNGGDEPLGSRIVEVANDSAKPYLPPGPAYTAYVPKGSIAQGTRLVTAGGGKTTACATCHGANLLGKDDVPAIAGRSALHTARELYEFKDGTRGGASGALMKGVVANLQDADIIAISAYLASRPAG